MPYYTGANFYPETSVGYLLRVCNQLTFAQLDQALAPEGLTLVQWSALISIHVGRGGTCAALARDMAHDKGAMTRMIDTLEARGLVLRARDSDDRRLNLLSLTTAGEAAAMRCRERVIACWNGWLDGWHADEIDVFLAQLRRLRATLETSPPCAA